jgi:hypothetical protein
MDGSEWVFARTECSLSQAFDRLRKEVRDDVELKNKLSRAGGQAGFCFDIRHESDGAFGVFLQSVIMQRSVRFAIGIDLSIVADGQNPPVQLRATLGRR